MAVAVSALGCGSTSTQLESIQKQLADIQLQVLQLQKQGPSKAQVEELESSVSGRIQDLLESEADLRLEVGTLAESIEQLEDKLEETNFRLQQLSQQIAATNQELQVVRNAAERARIPPPPRPAAPADPQALYDAAYNDYQQGNIDLAILGFQEYAEAYPDSELADNATYWLGECYYRQGKFQRAVAQYDVLLSDFQRSDHTASALLKKGYAYIELGERAQGIVQLQNVFCEYRGTDEARLAGQRLQEMGIDVTC